MNPKTAQEQCDSANKNNAISFLCATWLRDVKFRSNITLDTVSKYYTIWFLCASWLRNEDRDAMQQFDWTHPVDFPCGWFDGTNSLKTARKVIECSQPPYTDAVLACLPDYWIPILTLPLPPYGSRQERHDIFRGTAMQNAGPILFLIWRASTAPSDFIVHLDFDSKWR